MSVFFLVNTCVVTYGVEMMWKLLRRFRRKILRLVELGEAWAHFADETVCFDTEVIIPRTVKFVEVDFQAVLAGFIIVGLG